MYQKIKYKTHDEWLALRRSGVGGSDIAAIMGLNKYKNINEVWREKVYGYSNNEETEAMRLGILFEPIIATEFAQRYNVKIKKPNAIFRSKKYPFLIATVDYLIKENDKMGVLEIKTTSSYNFHHWANSIPESYYIQLQHYLAVTGYQFGYFAVLVGGQSLQRIRIERDELAINDLINAAQNFWNYVESKTEPPLQIYYEDLPEYAVEANIDILNLYNDILLLKSIIKENQDKLDEKLEIVKKYMGDKEEVVVDNRVIFTNKTIVKNVFDTEKFKNENPIIYSQYIKQTNYRTLKIIGDNNEK